jgi:hypothetical protein
MMKARVGIGGGDLDITSRVKVTWVLPPGQEEFVLPPLASKQETTLPSLKYAACSSIRGLS